ncbi:MAG: type III-A CRISPR-associated RAMP protein Csm5 [Desulfobulbus sp.]|jgi:CRISPR-associated protein Csm5|nr:type III-A CRISPR-associated RAMP protein Csm5 [Desulfobulbus sp.]
MNFLKTYHLAITPLSPIHIGCGEDFEPTNYVIDADRERLYGFDPGRTILPEELAQKLTRLAESANLLGIQRFFRDNHARFIPYSQVMIPVAAGVASDYQNKVGKVVNVEGSGKQVFNQFTIERHVHSRNTPYIPGSGLKGALRTALMDRLNGKRPVYDRDEKEKSTKLAGRLLGGDFSTSPLRLLKVADCLPTGDIARQVLYAVNRYKQRKYDRKTGQEKAPRGVVARKESILAGQYRGLAGTITIHDLGDKGSQGSVGGKRIVPDLGLRPELARIAMDCNEYHLPRLLTELSDMDQAGMLDPAWKADMERLLAGELQPLLAAGQAMLVRLGKYGGAESKTLSGVAEIKIMKARVGGRQEFEFLNKTKTFWFAATRAEAQKNMLPFGWALVEIAPRQDLPQLQAWCEQQSSGRPDMHEEYSQLAAALRAAESAATDLRQQVRAAEAAERKRQEEQCRQEDELRRFPWRAFLPELRQTGNWDDLQKSVAKIVDWLSELEVAEPLKEAAERVRTNYPKTWTPERDGTVTQWLTPSGLPWSVAATTVDGLGVDEANGSNRVAEAGFKDFGDWLGRGGQLGVTMASLTLEETRTLHGLFRDWNLDNRKSWKKSPAKKEVWNELQQRLRQFKAAD